MEETSLGFQEYNLSVKTGIVILLVVCMAALYFLFRYFRNKE